MKTKCIKQTITFEEYISILELVEKKIVGQNSCLKENIDLHTFLDKLKFAKDALFRYRDTPRSEMYFALEIV